MIYFLTKYLFTPSLLKQESKCNINKIGISDRVLNSKKSRFLFVSLLEHLAKNKIYVGIPAVGKTPFSGNTPFSSQTGGKHGQNASFRDISVFALQNAPRLHTNQTKARSNGVFPTAGIVEVPTR
jgi:hypothetical protein